MRQANQNENCHVGNSYHVFSVFGQITPPSSVSTAL